MEIGLEPGILQEIVLASTFSESPPYLLWTDVDLGGLCRSILDHQEELRHNLNHVARLEHKVALFPIRLRLVIIKERFTSI